jgi:hypothetical protein
LLPQQGPPALDPRLENDLFLANRSLEVMVSPHDNDVEHLRVHGELGRDPRLSIAVHEALVMHAQQHQAAMQAKQQMAQMQAQQQLQQMQGAPPGGPGGPPGPGGPMGMPGMSAATNGHPNGPSAPTMNPGRPAGVANEANLMRGLSDGGG